MFTQLDMKDRHTQCTRCNYRGCITSINKHGPMLGHWVWVVNFYKSKLSLIKAYNRLIRRLKALDYSKIEDYQVEGIDTRDYPDFCDAYISWAQYKGRDMTDAELDRLNEDRDFVYEAVQERLY